MNVWGWALLLGFGALGVTARYLIGSWVAHHLTHVFPVGTLAINILGSFLIGLVYVLGSERNMLSPEMRVALAVGFLGGFTTFSAYSLEVVRLFEQGEIATAFGYVAVSPALGTLAAWGGICLGRI
jgi:CrcB protein